MANWYDFWLELSGEKSQVEGILEAYGHNNRGFEGRRITIDDIDSYGNSEQINVTIHGQSAWDEVEVLAREMAYNQRFNVSIEGAIASWERMSL